MIGSNLPTIGWKYELFTLLKKLNSTRKKYEAIIELVWKVFYEFIAIQDLLNNPFIKDIQHQIDFISRENLKIYHVIEWV